MSRIGLKPIVIPEGVEVNIDGNKAVVKGPKGELEKTLNSEMKINIEGNEITIERPTNSKKHKSLHGTTRSLLNNMIQGVHKEYTKNLEIVGVGYRAQKQGNKVVLNAGYSHPVEIEEQEGIEIDVPKNTQLVIKGIDKELVGAVASNIRSIRPPEPYKGKGVRYENERILIKEGKTAK